MIVFSVNSLDFTKEPNIQVSVEKQLLNRHSSRSVRTNQASIEIRRVQLAFKDQCSCRYLYLNISLYQNYFHCIFFYQISNVCELNISSKSSIFNIQATKGCVIYQPIVNRLHANFLYFRIMVLFLKRKGLLTIHLPLEKKSIDPLRLDAIFA